MMTKKRLAWLMVPLMLALLAGCGSNRDSDEVIVTRAEFGSDPATGIAFVSTAVCIECHADISFSQELIDGYLGSKHVNHSTTISADSPASCLECHDPIGDGPLLETLIDPANVPPEGLAAVGCENCHGPGGEHFGVGPIPSFDPDFEVCGKCHQALPELAGFHPEGLNIVENYRQSEHSEEARTSAPCFRCHSDEGFEQYVAGTRGLDDENLEMALETAPPVEDDPIQCHTCHDPHETGTLRVAASDVSRDSEGTTFGRDEAGDRIRKKNFSSQFNLCTACHQAFLEYVLDEESELFTYSLFYDPANPEENDVPHHGNETDPNVDERSRTIVDTHFNYIDPDGINAPIDGYNINAADDNACRNCHEVHAATKFTHEDASTIATQWASSGHADYLGEPFTHDFSSGECMKCHSGTEYARFVQGVPQDELALAGGPRVIACVACHDLMAKNAAGDFELGATREIDEVVFPSGAVKSLVEPDGHKASNLCMECHQGRESGLSVANEIAENPGGPHSFTNRHYFAAAAILFGTDVTAGFEYEGQTYLGENTFEVHPPSLRTCTGCHMRKLSEETPNHTFEPRIEVCASCHEGIADFQGLGLPFSAANVDYDGDGVGESFQGEIDGMEELLLTAIQDYAADSIGAPIIYSAGSYPYWFKDTDGDRVVDDGEASFGNRYTDFDDKLLAAAYNYHSNQDPCSDMHNYKYVLQTTYDSIDDLDDGVLNDSVNGGAATRPATP